MITLLYIHEESTKMDKGTDIQPNRYTVSVSF